MNKYTFIKSGRYSGKTEIGVDQETVVFWIYSGKILRAVSVGNVSILNNFVSVQSLHKAVLPTHSMLPHQGSQTWRSGTGVYSMTVFAFLSLGSSLFDLLLFYLIYLCVIQWEHTEYPVVCPNLQTSSDKLLNSKVNWVCFPLCT